MDADRVKWNERYAGDVYQMGLAPSRFLEERLDLLARLCPGRRALDIACGEGRNSIFLAQHGFQVTGIDISDRGIEKGRARMAREGVAVEFLASDLEETRIAGPYDLIININFLLRELILQGVTALVPGGLFLFETILDAPTLLGSHTRHFLLQPGELPRLFAGFDGVVLEYAEFPEATVPTGRLIFRKHPLQAR